MLERELREDTPRSGATATQQRLAREHAERMRRLRGPQPPTIIVKPPPRRPIESIMPEPADRPLPLVCHGPPRMLSSKMIQTIVAEHYGLKRAHILGDRRLQSVVLARHIAVFLSFEMLHGS
jgi:hypothetical protein